MKDLDLTLIKEMVAKATPGPWENETDWDFVLPVNQGEDASPICGDCTRRDSSFIALARTAVPELIAEVERLREELSKYQSVCSDQAEQRDNALAAEKKAKAQAYDIAQDEALARTALAKAREGLEFITKAEHQARQLAFQRNNPSTIFIDAIGKARAALADIDTALGYKFL